MDVAGYERKLDRANEHIDTLDKAINRWLNRGGYSLVTKPDPQTGYQIIRAEIKKPLDPAWPLVIGDAVHSLRAALDHIVFSLTETHQEATNPGQPLPPGLIRASEFPIIGDRNEISGVTGDGEQRFDSAAGTKLSGVSPDARTAIKALQPYHRGAQYEADELWLVHDLDRVDKHRGLLITAAAVSVDMAELGGSGYFPHLWIGGGAVEHGTKVGEYAVPTGPNPYMKLDFRRYVGFDEGTSAKGLDVVATLRELRAYIETKVVPELVRFL